MRRLTPMDIYNKEFKHAIRGYDVNEVNEFLDLIISNYEEVLEENKRLKEQVKKLEMEKEQNPVIHETGSYQVMARDLSQYDQIIRDILLRIEQIERRIGLYAR
ncbi:DivIVA domain-containing protein [Thermoflavimicrobium dichotomicum]|uniref:DivIVA domain-containing protein n=1 Tax=Thermoflavimicrobium dichotomicum TaxID=46223 RepID=A0A1I3NF86_9BACL|nr:DivIVA domain-containing protein [Thermoflavimicrobium dichotomicum]SFJ07792.1 DivIVA domain-containing protein [Thermoflavimicrobium dichotomicum]